MLFKRCHVSYNNRGVGNLDVEHRIRRRARTVIELDSEKCTQAENEPTLPDKVEPANSTSTPMWQKSIFLKLYFSPQHFISVLSTLFQFSTIHFSSQNFISILTTSVLTTSLQFLTLHFSSRHFISVLRTSCHYHQETPKMIGMVTEQKQMLAMPICNKMNKSRPSKRICNNRRRSRRA